MKKETEQKKTTAVKTAPKAEKKTATVKVAKPRTATKTVTVVGDTKKKTAAKTTAKTTTTKKVATAKKTTKKTIEVETSIFEKANRLPKGNVVDIEETANKKTKVLYVTSECLPFCATGGLADVAGSLPKFIAQNDKNIDMRVVLPLTLIFLLVIEINLLSTDTKISLLLGDNYISVFFLTRWIMLHTTS